jgi:hypothetical protein
MVVLVHMVVLVVLVLVHMVVLVVLVHMQGEKETKARGGRKKKPGKRRTSAPARKKYARTFF